MTTSPFDTKLLQGWDASKQAAWRQRNPQELLMLHVLLDVSPSMYPHRANLIRAYNLYLAWLKRTAHPMSLGEVTLFDQEIRPLSRMQALGQVRPLDSRSYDPSEGDGTALYNAVGEVCTTAAQPGQHILLLFTDGEDCAAQPVWTAPKCQELLTALQAHSGWLCVFLGAFPEALTVARSMGFHEGNCLTFPGDQIPEAFDRLRQATGRYLAAAPAERKLLTEQGVF